VSERAGAKAGGSNPSAKSSTFASDAVKGIPIFGKAVSFAGHCWNGDLGRPATSCWFLQHEGRADDSGCPSDAEEGNVVELAQKQARAPGTGTKNRASAQETRPSLGPKTRARQSSLHIERKLGGGALAMTSRLGKLAQAGGTSTGVVVRGRSATRRVSIAPAREAAWHARKGRRSRPPSLRGSRARVWLLARRCMLQKSAGGVWSRISSANALQKERQGRVNRDLAIRVDG
jgi:hypothetical protein